MGFTARVMVLRHQCSFFKESDIDTVLRNYAHVPRPNSRFAVGVQIEKEIFQKLKNTRAKEVHQDTVDADPWDDMLYWHDEPSEPFPHDAPNKLLNREFPDFVHLGGGECVARADHEAGLAEAARNAPRPGEAVKAVPKPDPAKTKEQLLTRAGRNLWTLWILNIHARRCFRIRTKEGEEAGEQAG